MKTKNLVRPNDAVKRDIEPLTVRICKLLRDDGDKTISQISEKLRIGFDTAKYALKNLQYAGCVMSHPKEKGTRVTWHFEKMPNPVGDIRKPKFHVSTTGNIVPPRYVPPFKPMARRDIFENMRLSNTTRNGPGIAR